MSIASGLRTFFKLRQERHDSGADDLPASSIRAIWFGSGDNANGFWNMELGIGASSQTGPLKTVMHWFVICNSRGRTCACPLPDQYFVR